MHAQDKAAYDDAKPGELFRPRFLPAGFWLQVDDFTESPLFGELLPYFNGSDEVNFDDSPPGPSMQLFRERQGEQRAKSLFFLPAMEAEIITFKSTEKHSVKRVGFALTHAFYLTATASQGQTIRTGVRIDCGRLQPAGGQGMSDDNWWLNLYVMFSRATKMEDMLLLRPPEREFLERGPPQGVREQLRNFSRKIERTSREAERLANEFGFTLPND